MVCGRNWPAWLENAAVSAGLVDQAWMRRLRLLDPLRAEPPFQALLHTVETRAAQVAAVWSSKTETLEEALTSLPA